MKLGYKLALSLILLSAFCAGLTAGSRQEFTKAIKREFDITANGTTSIANQYGKVEVKTWNRNRVKIDVTIIVNASSEEAAQKVFERIDIAFSNTAGAVKAITTIQPQKKGFWDWGSGGDKPDYSINYEVFLPPTNNLELEHKYGDVYVAALTGKINAEVKYANLKMDGLSDDSALRFSYGNGSIVRAEDLVAELSYAKLIIKEANDLEINSKYTQLTVDRAAAVRTSSKYDDYSLGTVGTFRNVGQYDNIAVNSAEAVNVSGRYTQVTARKVTSTLDLDLKYGGASVGLARGFSMASLAGNYTDFKLDLESGTEYQVDATASYAGIVYPRALTVTYELEKGSSHEVKGHQGNGGLIQARLSYGGLKIREQ